MRSEILDIVDEYLKSVTDPVTGMAWTSHEGADYVYWADDRARKGAISSPVNARDLLNRDLIHCNEKGIELWGPNSVVQLPLAWDVGKIRRRLEDALRKTVSVSDLLRIADIVGVKVAESGPYQIRSSQKLPEHLWKRWGGEWGCPVYNSADVLLGYVENTPQDDNDWHEIMKGFMPI